MIAIKFEYTCCHRGIHIGVNAPMHKTHSSFRESQFQVSIQAKCQQINRNAIDLVFIFKTVLIMCICLFAFKMIQSKQILFHSIENYNKFTIKFKNA